MLWSLPRPHLHIVVSCQPPHTARIGIHRASCRSLIHSDDGSTANGGMVCATRVRVLFNGGMGEQREWGRGLWGERATIRQPHTPARTRTRPRSIPAAAVSIGWLGECGRCMRRGSGTGGARGLGFGVRAARGEGRGKMKKGNLGVNAPFRTAAKFLASFAHWDGCGVDCWGGQFRFL